MNHALLGWLLLSCSGDGPLIPVQIPEETITPEVATPAPATRPAREFKYAESGEGIAAADLDGDGFDEMLFFHEGSIFIGENPIIDIDGKLQVSARGDINGDGDEEAVLGFGEGRGVRAAPASVWVVHEDRADQLWSRDGARNQITDLDVVDGRIFMATFSSSKNIESGWVSAEGFSVQDNALMATTQEVLQDGTVLVGRLYGDQPRSDGDLQHRSQGQILGTLPSIRGVKSLLATQLDDDPELEVLVGDGWHYQYGLRALAHLRLMDGINLDGTRTIALLTDSYSINAIEPVRADSPGQVGLLLTASSGVHLLHRDGLGWKEQLLHPVDENTTAVVAYLEDGPWALISGDPAMLVPINL